MALADLRGLICKLAKAEEQRDLYPRAPGRFWILELLNRVKLGLTRGGLVENLMQRNLQVVPANHIR